jgi:hypothetical protein
MSSVVPSLMIIFTAVMAGSAKARSNRGKALKLAQEKKETLPKDEEKEP